jgi:DegV family protein with EDD domain
MEKIKAFKLAVVPFFVSVNGKEYLKDKEELSSEDFVNTLLENPDYAPKTSTPTPGSYIEAFKAIVEEGKAVLCICMSQTFTSAIRTAEAAKDAVLEKLPHSVIEIVDGEQVSVSQGEIIEQAVNMRDENLTLPETIDKLTIMKKTARTYLFLQNTKYLAMGGRIGKVSSIATSLLNIKPLIVIKNGESSPLGVARSRKAAMTKLVAALKEYVKTGLLKKEDYCFAIAAAFDAVGELPLLRQMIETEIGVKVKDYEYAVGATVAAHAGPGVMGISIMPLWDKV